MGKKALVVVLGDLARSPRMQYHCVSLAEQKFDVTVIASKSANDKACEKLESNTNIRQQLMKDTFDFGKYFPSQLAFILKPIWQTILLIIQLCLAPIPHVIIVQNPPSIPTLPVIYLYSLIVRSKLIIDWHNYGFSILSLKLSPSHHLVSMMKILEIYFGRLAHAGFCVSEAMQRDLCDNYYIRYPLYVLYDKPPSHFKPLDLGEKHEFYVKIKAAIPEFEFPLLFDSFDPAEMQDPLSRRSRETRFTIADERDLSSIKPRYYRPAIILSSTSWTEDEDFDLLLNALELYDKYLKIQHDNYTESDFLVRVHWRPNLICVITGKGPLKQHYERKIQEMKLKRVEFVLPWLSAEDYAKMVGSCDLGISLHSSSSGVDLPMKVVDLFGCAIPVLAYRYKAINELVKEDFYGLTFRNSQELFSHLSHLLNGFAEENSTDECSDISRYKRYITRHFLDSSWESNWKQIAKPVFDRLCS